MGFIFVCAEHPEFGSNGWRLKSQPDFDPLGGMAVAHDCLEHFSDDDSVAAEFMALGASMFVRDELFYNRKGKAETNPGTHIASDMPEIMKHVLYEGYEFPAAPRTKKLEAHVEGWMDHMFSCYAKELSYCEPEDKDLRLGVATKQSIRSYMRIGYRKAVSRYKNRDGEVQNLFCKIEDKADKYLRSSKAGTELHVVISFSNLTATIYTLEPWETDD